MEEIKTRSLSVSDTLSISELIGKDIVSKSGKKIGRVSEIHVNPDTLEIEGVRSDTGFLNDSEYFGKNYINHFTDRSVILKIDPVTELVGLEVVDSSGKKVGKVKEIGRSGTSNTFESLKVSRGTLRGDLIVPRTNVMEINESRVRLKERIDD